MHRPRGSFCHRGWCQQCRVTLDDGRVVLACETPDASRVARKTRWLGRLAGALAERVPPWFYEHRFLWPRTLRQFYLDRLRRMSAAPALPPGIPVAASRVEDHACDVLVVGGGLAGLAAATTIARAGKRVTLIEGEALGGSALFATGLGHAAHSAIDQAVEAGVVWHERTLCVALYREPDRALCVGPQRTTVVRFDRLVVATGAYDRLPLVSGNDLPGIAGIRAFERLAAQHALPSRARIGVYGDRVELERVLRTAVANGQRIEWIAGGGDLPDAACSRHPNASLVSVHGNARVRAVELSTIGRLRCDLLVIAQSQPTYELQAQWGIAPWFRADLGSLQPSILAHRSLLIVGEAAGTADLATVASSASEAAAAWIANRPLPVIDATSTRALRPVRAADGAFVCLCEDVRVRDVRRAIGDGYRDVELIKRHTGAGTGPCQGKLCHANLMHCLSEAGLDVRLPTPRPFVRPVPLACFAGRGDD